MDPKPALFQRIFTTAGRPQALALLLGIAAAVASATPTTAQGAGTDGSTTTAENPTVLENRLRGSGAWRLRKPVPDDFHSQIKGYADATSVDRGEAIRFKVTVHPAQPYTIEIFRIGWYQGRGGRLMKHIGPLRGTAQRPCGIVDGATDLVECRWSTSYELRVPLDWTSGSYLAVLRNERGYSNYISFTVRDDTRHAAILFQNSVTTWQAYNHYGGRSLYTSPRAYKVSFDRPYARHGSRLVDWELKMIRWLEREGYDVAYSTDIDTHAHGERLLDHRAFLSVGHDEYWSWEMRDAVENARDHGVDLGFLGGNTSYWQIRLEPSRHTGAANRVIVGYKEFAAHDPVRGSRQTTLFRRAGRPEQRMMGTMYGKNLGTHGHNLPFTVRHANSWVFAGTRLHDGDRIPNAYGYEYDTVQAGYALPRSTQFTVLSRSTDRGGGHASSTIYQAPSGALVFSAGTTDWSWMLDGYGKYDFVDRRIQQITRNILDRFCRDAGTTGPVGQEGQHADEGVLARLGLDEGQRSGPASSTRPARSVPMAS